MSNDVRLKALRYAELALIDQQRNRELTEEQRQQMQLIRTDLDMTHEAIIEFVVRGLIAEDEH